MKAFFNRTNWLIVLCVLINSAVSGQDTIITFNASELTPSDTGYYTLGIPADVDEDGIIEEGEWANGCMDFYEDYHNHSNNDEAGEYNGFSYMGGMVMPTCESKKTIEPPVQTGYIQLRPSATMDSAVGAIISPEFKNLTSLAMDLSADVSVSDRNLHAFYVEYSTNNGTTWEAQRIEDNLFALSGTAGAVHASYDSLLSPGFRPIMAASRVAPVKLRIISLPYDDGGRLLNIHKMEITAEIPVISVKELASLNKPLFEVKNSVIIALQGEITVFNILGQLIGSGKSVAVPQGIYIVKTPDSMARKVYVE